jgi:hypothetical protein
MGKMRVVDSRGIPGPDRYDLPSSLNTRQLTFGKKLRTDIEEEA